jgi:ABC-type glycerol-3-phosphate transport system substrate-binding protein
MSKTFIRVFRFNYDVSSMSESYTSLEEATEKYLKENPELEIKQIEFLWGNQYGARVAVLFEHGEPKEIKGDS